MGLFKWLDEKAKKSGPKLLNGRSYQEHIEGWSYQGKCDWDGMIRCGWDVLTEDFLIRYLPEISRHSEIFMVLHKYNLTDRFMKCIIQTDKDLNIYSMLYSDNVISENILLLAINKLENDSKDLSNHNRLSALSKFWYQKNSSYILYRIIELFPTILIKYNEPMITFPCFFTDFKYIKLSSDDMELFWGGL